MAEEPFIPYAVHSWRYNNAFKAEDVLLFRGIVLASHCQSRNKRYCEDRRAMSA